MEVVFEIEGEHKERLAGCAGDIPQDEPVAAGVLEEWLVLLVPFDVRRLRTVRRSHGARCLVDRDHRFTPRPGV